MNRPGLWAPTAITDDIGSVAKMIDQCNDYGLDTIEMGNVLSVYMEATECGYLNGDGGLPWGDYEAMVAPLCINWLSGKALEMCWQKVHARTAKALWASGVQHDGQRAGDPGL